MINNLVMAVLLESGLPKSYWGEAVFYVIHILNAISPRKLAMSPFEAIFQRKPKIEMFHPFGCEAWVHIPKAHRKKFDVKSKRMTFLGFQPQHQVCHLLDIETN